MGPIEQAVTGADPEQRRDLFHQMVVDALVAGLPETWESEHNVTFEITVGACLDWRTGSVRLEVNAHRDGTPLPGIDNPYLFENPPFLIADPDDEDAAPIEDPVAAIRTRLEQVVIVRAVQLGWDL